MYYGGQDLVHGTAGKYYIMKVLTIRYDIIAPVLFSILFFLNIKNKINNFWTLAILVLLLTGLFLFYKMKKFNTENVIYFIGIIYLMTISYTYLILESPILKYTIQLTSIFIFLMILRDIIKNNFNYNFTIKVGLLFLTGFTSVF